MLSDEVLKLAVPPPSVPVPKVVVPSLNVTVPVGVPAPGDTGATVAVNVTDWPKTAGFAEEVTLVVVAVWLTVWATTADVLAVKLVSPLYTAVMLWEPAPSDEVLNVAVPPPIVPVPKVVVPSLNVTVPVGIPAPGDTGTTVAVNVTDWPKSDGFNDEVRPVVVFAWLTVWVTALDVLVVKSASPL
jgi:hypothetical protein